MKKLLATNAMLLAVFFSSCTCMIEEDEAIIIGVKKGYKHYKYCYEVNAFPVNQSYYSNEELKVGDTLALRKKYCQ